jgi:hypothetical protein
MIDKIKAVFEQGHPMSLATKAGVRNITLEAGKVIDPLGEISSYVVEPDYNGRITIRFYNDNQAKGYLQYKRDGNWTGNNRSSWLEMRPIDATIWMNLKDFVPEKKQVINPHVEPVRDKVNYFEHEVNYDWEPTSEEAVVLLIHHTNSKYETLLPLIQGGRDLIVEVDDLAISGKAAVIQRVKELAPNAHIVEHKVQFGLGYLIVNCHRNVFSKYKRALILTDDLTVSEGSVDLAFNLLGNNSQDVAQIYGPSVDLEEVNSAKAYEYTVESGPLAAYCMSSEAAEKIASDIKEFAETFLQSKYESRSHHSIRKWLKDKFNILGQDVPTGILDVIGFVLKAKGVVRYATVLPRAVKTGVPYSTKSDAKRKKFTLGD